MSPEVFVEILKEALSMVILLVSAIILPAVAVNTNNCSWQSLVCRHQKWLRKNAVLLAFSRLALSMRSMGTSMCLGLGCIGGLDYES